jgi:hypothetical protein
MAGIKALRKIQLGREGTAGTAVAATAIWRGVGTIEDQRETVFPPEDVGYIGGLDRAYTPKYLGALVMEDTPVCYENIMHILEAGVKTIGTGVADTGTGASGKVYAYTFPTTAKNTIKTYTIEGGDDQEQERMEYSYVSDFKISGKGGEAVMVGATWAGRQVAPNTMGTAAALPTVEEVLFSKGALYIDAVDGTIGTTQISNTFLGMDLNGKTGWTPVWTADGALYFTFCKLTEPEVLLNITFEHDAGGVAQKVLWRAGTARQIRLNFPGSALGTAGVFSTKVFRVDLAGKWEKFDKIGEQDGNDIIAGTFRARYNASAALFGEIKVVNEIAAVP